MGVCPGEFGRFGGQDLKRNSFDFVVQVGDQWEAAVGMAPVLHMCSFALNCNMMEPIEDRLAVAVGTQAVVASLVVDHWGQIALVRMSDKEVEAVNWTAEDEAIVSWEYGDGQ